MKVEPCDPPRSSSRATLCNNSGSFATLAAIRRASSFVSSFAVERPTSDARDQQQKLINLCDKIPIESP
jgi:hypothetical protein